MTTYRNYKEIILLTGCINPNGMSFTQLQDPEKRKVQYIDAINFYLKKTDLPVLFVENSGTDISKFFESGIAEERLEIITFNGNDYDKKLGKGYGEMIILEKALKDSRLMREAKFFFKITGRYKLLNINAFLKQHQKKPVELLVDLKHQLQYSDSRFWGSTILFLEEILLNYKDRVNDSKRYFFEHALCHATHEAIVSKYSFSCLKFRPRYRGVSATDNRKHSDSLFFWLPLNFKQFIKYKSLS